MTLPTGTITMAQVNTELGNSSSSQISLNDTAVRNLASKPSGTVSMNDLRGKSSFGVTGGTPYSSNGSEYNVFTSAGPLTVSGGPLTLEYVMIGAGGGGGGSRGPGPGSANRTGPGNAYTFPLPGELGGGGGSGAYRQGVIEVPGNMTSTVVVGSGGGGGSTTPSSATNGGEGGTSSFTLPPDIGGYTIHAGGGGGGASCTIGGKTQYGPNNLPNYDPGWNTRGVARGSGGGGHGTQWYPGPNNHLPPGTQRSAGPINSLFGVITGYYFSQGYDGSKYGGGGAGGFGGTPPAEGDNNRSGSQSGVQNGKPHHTGGQGVLIPSIFQDVGPPSIGYPYTYSYITYVYLGQPAGTTTATVTGGLGKGGNGGGATTPGGGLAGDGLDTGIFSPSQNASSNSGSGGGGNRGTRLSGTEQPGGPGEGSVPTWPYVSSANSGGSGGSGVVVFRHLTASNPSNPSPIPGIGPGGSTSPMPSNAATGIRSSNLVSWMDATNARSYSGAGNTWKDLSGNNNNGTLQGAADISLNNAVYKGLAYPYYDIGGGGGLNFAFGATDGIFTGPPNADNQDPVPPTSKYINMGSSLGRTSKGTISMWVQIRGPVGTTIYTPGLYLWGAIPNFWMRTGPSGSFVANVGGSTVTTATTNPSDDKYVFVALTWDQPAGTSVIYQGPVGGYQTSMTYTTPGSCGSVTPRSGNLWFGASSAHPTPTTMDGLIYQVHVYNDSLPSTDILFNFNAMSAKHRLYHPPTNLPS